MNRASKLDTFKPAITELLEKDPTATAAVIAQRLRQLGYQGGITIVKDYLMRCAETPQLGGPLSG